MQKALESLPGVANFKADVSTATCVVLVDATKFDKKKAMADLDVAGYPESKVIKETVLTSQEKPSEDGEATGVDAKEDSGDSEPTTSDESDAADAKDSAAPDSEPSDAQPVDKADTPKGDSEESSSDSKESKGEPKESSADAGDSKDDSAEPKESSE